MSMTRRSFAISLLTLALAPWAWAAAASREDQLKERFEERDPEIRSLKQSGVAGETFAGYVEVVEGKTADKDAKALVKEENKDREALYDLIAEKEGVTREKVAERNARRVFEKAKPGEHLKGSDGKWKKKP